MHVNKNLISTQLTWKLIKYLGLLFFPLLVVVPIPFPWSLSAWSSWMGVPCTTDQAQKREANKSPRFDAHQSLSRARMGGKAWIVPLLPDLVGSWDALPTLAGNPLSSKTLQCFLEMFLQTHQQCGNPKDHSCSAGRTEAAQWSSDTSGEAQVSS